MKCKICDTPQKEIVLVDGICFSVYAEKEEGKTRLIIVGDNGSSCYPLKFCPECGRKLQKE